MQIFYSPRHALRRQKLELAEGGFVEAFERPERIDMILAELERRGLGELINIDTLDGNGFGMEEVRRVHEADYLDFLESAYADWQKAGHEGDAMSYVWPARSMRADRIPESIEARIGYYALCLDTTITEGTWEAALAAKDLVLAGVRAIEGVLGRDGAGGKGAGESSIAAFALCRPPGHHASRAEFGGYCFLNNAAIGAEALLARGAKRVSILDVDFHHGNGTQSIFYGRADVQFLSIHGDPRNCFPYFLGYSDEKGEGEGEGHNFNFPLPPGTEYGAWKKALMAALAKISDYAPDALIISLGVDAFRDDPISDFCLASQDFLDMGQMIGTLALPTLFVMEGGYAIEEIGINTANVLEGFGFS